MTTTELERTETCVAWARLGPSGELELDLGGGDASAYGPVEIEWYRDRVRITALGAGPASIATTFADGEAEQDLVVEIRLPSLDELTETVPGAD